MAVRFSIYFKIGCLAFFCACHLCENILDMYEKSTNFSFFELFLEAKQQQPEKSTSNKWFSAEYVL